MSLVSFVTSEVSASCIVSIQNMNEFIQCVNCKKKIVQDESLPCVTNVGIL